MAAGYPDLCKFELVQKKGYEPKNFCNSEYNYER